MKLLPLTLDDPIFRYEQIARDGMVALYRQTHKVSGVNRFEVIHIQARKEHTWPNGQTTPAHEGYPSSRQWGQEGWTYGNLPTAQAALAQLVKTEDARHG